MLLRIAILLVATLALGAQSPNDTQSLLKSADGYLVKFRPGLNTPENLEMARLATAAYERVLQVDPNNVEALRHLASLGFMSAQAGTNQRDRLAYLDQAENWNRRLLAVNSQDKVALYSLGVIAWAKAYPEIQQARAGLGMRPEDPGPLKEAGVRTDLLRRLGPTLRDGMTSLETALAVDPMYGDAMAYLNLLFRLRADLSDNPDDYKRDITAADEWVQKALDARRQNPGAMMIAPPPPPPTPGLRVPSQIRVGGNVQAYKLISAPRPVYPLEAKQARIQGVVRFNVVIARDGIVQNATLVSGHPLLVPAATDAVRQFVYQQTLLNGEPVEVVTQVDVNFTLSQ